MGLPKAVVAEMVRNLLRALPPLLLRNRLSVARMRRPRTELVLGQPLSNQDFGEAKSILGILQLTRRDALQNGYVGPVQSTCVHYLLFNLLHAFDQCIRRESLS